MAIKVAIVDDHPLLIKGLNSMVQHFPDVEVTGAYGDRRSLLDGLEQQQPDLLLLDLQLKDDSGDEIARLLSKKYPSLYILVLTNLEQSYFIKLLISYGVKGYVLKSSNEEILLTAIRTVFRGQEYYDPAIRNIVIKTKRNAKENTVLTRREKEVLELIALNYSSADIADKLFLSKRTVDNHRANLLLKFQVKNSAGLIKKTLDLGLIK